MVPAESVLGLQVLTTTSTEDARVEDPVEAKEHDGKNPTEALRARPICGLPILEGLAQTSDAWDGGKIYDPREGKTFDVKMKLLDDGKLEVRGYDTIKLLGETQKWTKAPADLGRCKA